MFDWYDDPDHNDPVENTWPCPKCGHPFFAHNETGCHAVKWNQTFQCPESCKCEYWHNEKEEG